MQNEVWTIDVTSIKQKYYFFFILDLASRRIVYHDISRHDYTAAEATHILMKALMKENGVEPSRPVRFIHTDSGGIFLSKEWVECLKVNNILPSSVGSKTNQNQVSERFNRTFLKELREHLNKMLGKKGNKTNTLQLIGEASKYNFEKLIKITQEIILYYNSERPHDHLNGLPPDTWANQARQLPEQKYLVEDKGSIPGSEKRSENALLELPKEVLISHIETVQNFDEKIGCYKNIAQEDPEVFRKSMLDLDHKTIVPFIPLSKNDNSKEARMIRKYKSNVGSLELINQVKENKIDLSTMDLATQESYKKISKEVESWQETDIRYLETIMLQNQILLSNIEELNRKTDKLKLQNEELLDMTHYLVETAERAEEEKRLFLERKEKRQKAKKLQKRDCVN